MSYNLLFSHLIASIFLFSVGVKAFERVSLQQFSSGNFWEWTYFQEEPDTENWLPHIKERYQVTTVEDSRVLIEMMSYPADAEPLPEHVHHRFWVDVELCRKTHLELQRHRSFYISFESKSLDGQWSLISNQYKSLAFTEKFNCIADTSKNRIFVKADLNQAWFMGDLVNLAQIYKKRLPRASRYFTEHPNLKGVAHSKDFLSRNQNYRFELTDYLTQ